MSLITTVKNESPALPRLLASLAAQTVLPDEVIIADGGSTDNPREIIEQYTPCLNVVLLDCPGANISQGRNAAIARARHDLIASTDAGVRLDPHWLERLLAPFSQSEPPDVVSGFFVPDPHGAFETALAAGTLPALRDIRPAAFLPSSRSIAFRKRAWTAAGGYPEWLDYCEDLVFDLALRARGARFAFAPDAQAYFRPRPTLDKFFRQYYLYARGDGKADLWLKRHLARYATYLLALPFSLWLWTQVPAFALLLWLAGALVMFGTPYRRLLDLWGPLTAVGKLIAAGWVPVIRITGDTAKMVGYPVGVWWRIKRQP